VPEMELPTVGGTEKRERSEVKVNSLSEDAEKRIIQIKAIHIDALEIELELMEIQESTQSMLIQFNMTLNVPHLPPGFKNSFKVYKDYIFSNCKSTEITALEELKGSVRISGQSWVNVLMDLTNFPFDSHSLEIPFEPFFQVAKVSSFEMIMPRKYDDLWIVSQVATSRNEEGCFTLAFGLKRKSQFQVFHLIIPALSIMFFTFSIYRVEQWLLTDRMNFLIAVLLTQVALNFSLAGQLPQISYLTLFDRQIFLNIVTIVLILIGSMISEGMRSTDNWIGLGIFIFWFFLSLYTLFHRHTGSATKKAFVTYEAEKVKDPLMNIEH